MRDIDQWHYHSTNLATFKDFSEQRLRMLDAITFVKADYDSKPNGL